MRILPNHILVTNPVMRKYPADIPYIAVRSTVANALAKAKLIPIAIGPEMDREATLWLYKQCAGIVFTGGADWNPKVYNQIPAKETNPPQDERDDVEQLLFEKALTDKKPMVGICRGMQGLAIALYRMHAISTKESILIQEISHITSQNQRVPYEKIHRNKHDVTIASSTIAHEIFERATILMPKGHHQAVDKDVVSRLPHVVVSGLSTKDSFTEMIELNRSAHPFCFATQGHPELDNTLYLPLFRRLADEAEKFAENYNSTPSLEPSMCAA